MVDASFHKYKIGDLDAMKRILGIAAGLALALAGCGHLDAGKERDGVVSLAAAVPDAILEIRY